MKDWKETPEFKEYQSKLKYGENKDIQAWKAWKQVYKARIMKNFKASPEFQALKRKLKTW